MTNDLENRRAVVPPAALEQGYTMATEDVADYLGCTHKTVSLWISAGRLHPLRIGRRNYFRPDDVKAAARASEGGK